MCQWNFKPPSRPAIPDCPELWEHLVCFPCSLHLGAVVFEEFWASSFPGPKRRKNGIIVLRFGLENNQACIPNA